MKTPALVLTSCLLWQAGFAAAQAVAGGVATPLAGPDDSLVSLSASSSMEVPRDEITVRLRATLNGADAATVQNNLKRVVADALAALRSQTARISAVGAVGAGSASNGNSVTLETTDFQVQPQYANKGNPPAIVGWSGSAGIRVTGTDIARIADVTARVAGMPVEGVDYDISRATRQRLEAQAAAQAIEEFRAKAGQYAAAFGFGHYAIADVSVSPLQSGNSRRPMPMLAMARMAEAAPMPIPSEAGNDLIQVTVSGRIRLR